MKGKKKRDATGLPELPEARPLPQEANPGGTEGVDAAWPGGSSNLGEVINPEPEGDTTYSTKDLPPDVPRVEFVDAFVCDKCGQAFATEALLEHDRTKALYALSLDPLTAAVCSLEEIEKLFEEMWEAERDSLAPFAKKVSV